MALRQLNQQTQASQGQIKKMTIKVIFMNRIKNNVSDELEEGMVSSEEKQLNEDSSFDETIRKNELNEQQIQVLVDNAEREARQRKRKT